LRAETEPAPEGQKRLPSRRPEKLAVPVAANVCWSVDFMSDVLMSGQRFRTFNLLDGFNREALAIEVDTTLPAARIVRALDQVTAWRGCPTKLRMDNGPEFVSVALADGRKPTGWNWSSSSQASPHKTHLSSGSTAPSAKKCWISMFSAD
jgi:transposase InsO family protein